MAGGGGLLRALVALFAFALGAATEKLPLFAVSLTAPLFVWLAIEARAGGFSVASAKRWTGPAAVFWLACLASLAGGLLTGSLRQIENDELILLARFVYWLAIFVVVCGVTARAEWTPKLAATLAAVAVAVASMRLGEAGASGAWGGDTARWLSQNEYGLRLSAFVPFLFALAWTRTWAVAGLALALAAAAGNGSRSNWIALALAAVAVVAVRARAGVWSPRLAAGPVLAALALAGLVAAGPPEWSEPIRARWRSFAALDRDKPFQTRLALIDKGLALFAERPLLGAGLGRFADEPAGRGAPRTPWLTDADLNSRSPHNSYLKVLAETGLAGAAALAALLGPLLVGGWRAAVALVRRGEDGAAGAFAASVAVAAHLWTLSGLTGALPWFVFGVAAGAIERERRLRREEAWAPAPVPQARPMAAAAAAGGR